MRFDRYIAKRNRISGFEARTRIAGGQFLINNQKCTDLKRLITRFDEIRNKITILQPAQDRIYLKLHKPVGVVSATSDKEHTTVLDLIEHPDKETLHLAGRLDRSSSGLILLSNDSNWTELLTLPNQKVDKVYLIETDRPIPESAVAQFANGFHFASENVVTRPAILDILGPKKARVTLREGRWHQIKRMFHRIDGIRLTSLHREQIGEYTLGDLKAGDWCSVSPLAS